MRGTIIAAVLSLSIVGSCFAQSALPLTRRVETHIPPQALWSALNELATIRHMQVLYAAGDVRGLRAAGVYGELTVDQTLLRLLAGTGLAYRYVDSNAVSIIATPTSPTATHSKPTSLQLRRSSQKAQGQKSKSTAMGPTADPEPVGSKPLAKAKAPALREVTVTGTHIAGIAPVSTVITMTSQDIKDSGLPDIASAIRALPEDFGGGQNTNAVVAGGVNGGNTFLNISTANLRGIGAGDTLTLIDGHRLAGSGNLMYVDLSSIPTAAVERVEIESSGASAIYGADAVAGVVNVILKKNYSGAATDAYVGASPNGGLTQRYSQIVGRKARDGDAGLMLGYQFQSSSSIFADQRAVSSAAGSAFTLQPQQKANAAFLSTHYDPTDAATAYLNGFYTHRTSLQRWSGSEYQGAEDQFAADIGLTLQIPRNRTLGVDVSASGDSNSTTQYGGSRSMYNHAAGQERLLSASFTGQGELAQLSEDRIVRAALGAGLRREYFDSEGFVPKLPLRGGSRRVAHAYAEVNIPIFPASPSRWGLERLTLSAAGRFEHYSDFGSISVPKVELAWSPVRDITVSGTWGRSFQAPTLFQLDVARNVTRYPGSFFGLPYNKEVLFVTGANPDLTAQKATTRTLSAKWELVSGGLRGLSANISYFDIDFSDRINNPILNVTAALSDPLYAPFVALQPSAELQAAVISGANVFNSYGLSSSPEDVQALVFDTYQNVSAEVVHGVDATVGYMRETSVGRVMLKGSATWERFDQQLLTGAGLEQVAGTLFNPPTFKSRMMFGWSRRALGARVFVNHVSGELNTSITPVSHVASWTTIDTQLRYALAPIQVSVSAQNVLNRAPPSIPASSTAPPGIGFDSANYSAIGRFISLEMAVKW